MKKRKELDALLGNRGKGVYEPMHSSSFRVEPFSSSSKDGETFFTPSAVYGNNSYSKRVGRSIAQTQKNQSCSSKRIFYLCLPVCIFALVAACVSSSVGIVWVQMQLKSDIENIKERLSTLEHWMEDEPAALADLQNSVKLLEGDMKQGKDGIRAMAVKMDWLVGKSEDESPTQPSPLGLPESIDQLKKDLAKARADVSGMHHQLNDVKLSHTMLTKQVSDASAQVAKMKNDVERLIEDDRTSDHLDSLNSSMKGLKERVAELENTTSHLPSIIEEQSRMNDELYKLSQDVTYVNTSVKNLRDKDDELTNHMNRFEQVNKHHPHDDVKNDSVSFHEVPFHMNADGHGGSTKASHSVSKVKDGAKGRGGASIYTNNRLPHQDNASPEEVMPSRNTDVRVGDTTTSFTELPHNKR